MKFFEAGVVTIVLRLYLMMAAVIVPFVLGVPYLAIMALPIFLSVMLGVKIEFPTRVSKSNKLTAFTNKAHTNRRIAA